MIMSIRTRNWVLTINYKDSDPESDDSLYERILKLDHIRYFVFQLEQGEKGTNHHQMYLSFVHAKSFDHMKENFPTAHIEEMKGSPLQASEYCKKTSISYSDFDFDSFEMEPIESNNYREWGDLPQQGKRNDLIKIYDMLSDDKPMQKIMDEYPSYYLRYRNSLHTVWQDIMEEKFKSSFRYLNVLYISDIPGIGKTRYVMEKHGYENVYRVSNYKNPFDTYKCEDVILFEEFRESLPVEQMLNYLDGYPLKLPARYNDKVACYTKVYIISNWDFEKQYADYKDSSIKTYIAWLRRIKFFGNLSEVKKYESEIICSYD